MRTIKEVDYTQVSTGHTDYDLRAIGARGLQMITYGGLSTVWKLHAYDAALAQSFELCEWLDGTDQGDDSVFLRVPLMWDVLRVSNVYGAGTSNARLCFLDEPPAPYGRLPAANSTGTIGASGTSDVISLTKRGYARRLHCFWNTTKASSLLLTARNGGQSVGTIVLDQFTDAAGGAAYVRDIPCPMEYAVTIKNDDGAAGLSQTFCAHREL